MIYFIVLHYYLAINFKGTELAILVIFAEFVWGGACFEHEDDLFMVYLWTSFM